MLRSPQSHLHRSRLLSLYRPTTPSSSRTLHSTRSPLARLPTFTTPAPLPVTAAPTAPSRTAGQPLPPLPPTDLPVEDYASPLLHTTTFFSRLFRYSVYSSCTLVGVALSTLLTIHLYVEHVPLAQEYILSEEEDPERWTEETVQGWSGGWRKGGGTDPRLGVLARSAVRGAWIACNWGGGAGGVASPLSSASTSSSSSPFASSKTGGQMITTPGEQKINEELIGQDASLQLAEQYLLYALRRAELKGISLALPLDASERIISSSDHARSITFSARAQGAGGIDRAALELEQRLAGVREQMGGRGKLQEAYQGWERIYYALASSPPSTTATSTFDTREQLRASRKLGELSLRLGELGWRKGSQEWEGEMNRAEGWFKGGIVDALMREGGGAIEEKEEVGIKPEPESRKSSFFSFWSRSSPSPPSPPSSSSSASPLPIPSLAPPSPSIASLLPLLQTPHSSSSSAATNRALLSSLLSLSSLLARTNQLPSAHHLQSAALSWLSSTQPSQPSASTPGAKLHQQYLLTRRVVLQTHLAETSLALLLSMRRRPSPPAPAQQEQQASLALLESSINSAESILSSLPSSSSSSSSPKYLIPALQKLKRDTRVAGGMAANLVGLVREREGEGEVWYAKALEFLGGADGGEGEDLPGAREAREGLKRCRVSVEGK